MTTRPVQRALRFLASARLATLLIAFVGAWSILASFVPQGDAEAPAVAEWAAAHAGAEIVVAAVGLHHAFTAPLFLAAISVLGISTALCAWERTRVASRRARVLRDARATDAAAVLANHELEVPCDPALDPGEILDRAARTLREIGIKAERRDGVIVAASSSWSVWGSPIFHWALLALIITVAVGGLWRSSGLMGLAVGSSAPDAPASYGLLNDGPLRSWDGIKRTISVDAFDVTYQYGGVNRGPTPTVTVTDAQGAVIKSQQVYPNKTLKTGSLTIYPSDYGLAAYVSVLDATGAEIQRSAERLDFSGRTEDGTVPIAPLTLVGTDLTVAISVPLDRVQGGMIARVPREPKAHVVITGSDGGVLLDAEMVPGQDLALPTGDTLRLLDVGYYARLQLVDDPSIPVLYAVLVIAMIGLGLATLLRQQIVSAAVVESAEGKRLAVRMRLWRNVTSSRTEIERELTDVLGTSGEGSHE